MELARFNINHYVTVLLLGSDRIKKQFYQSPSLSGSKYMSNLDVRIVKSSTTGMILNLWNVRSGITNENRLFQSDCDITVILVNLDKNYEYFEKTLVQRTLIAKNSKLIVCGIHQDDERPLTRKNIVQLCKFCQSNNIDCLILSEEDNKSQILDKLLKETEIIRLSRKKKVNDAYQQWRNRNN